MVFHNDKDDKIDKIDMPGIPDRPNPKLTKQKYKEKRLCTRNSTTVLSSIKRLFSFFTEQRKKQKQRTMKAHRESLSWDYSTGRNGKEEPYFTPLAAVTGRLCV